MRSIVYCTGSIRFIASNRKYENQTYSDRSIIELLQDDTGRYILRALDVENNSQMIFYLTITKSDLYKFGNTDNDADNIDHPNGTYRVFLKRESREDFHKNLRKCIRRLDSVNPQSRDTNSGRSTENKPPTGLQNTISKVNEKTILADIHNLGAYIQNGKGSRAAELIKDLIASGVRLRIDTVKDSQDDKTIKIQIKIDGIDPRIINHEATLDMEVYSSTKIRELRALFEYTHKFPSVHQYFFVNGHLADGESTMNDLQIQDDRMSILAFTTGAIQFNSHDRRAPQRNYSERSLVQLSYDDDNNQYSLKAIDIENNKEVIFDFPVTNSDLYRFGRSNNEPDEIKRSNGTYQLWPHDTSRQEFHNTFAAICEMLNPSVFTNTTSETIDDHSIHINFDETIEPKIPAAVNFERKNILTNIHNLSKYIQQGNSDEATRMIMQFASQGARLQGQAFTQLKNEDQFQILVQLDGDQYGIDKDGGTIFLNVFPSTKVRELRAVFELLYHYSPSNQYFFVNGLLADDNSTMKELQVGPKSLFVLFLLENSKKL
ncbi:unnamed protein product [Rotaria magnacalcarata]|uniref:Ubiquitin-like domain-containing protein n=2 Tax=Rotaria magnacalcarata TaxID=392030 RepID=A0A816LTK9_9BILA|nr:unnamed protein product [Rotaria magnacalcarata]